MVITKIKIEGNIGEFKVEINPITKETYTMKFDLSDKYGECLESDMPKDMIGYKGQARIAIDQYFGKDIPDRIVSYTH